MTDLDGREAATETSESRPAPAPDGHAAGPPGDAPGPPGDAPGPPGDAPGPPGDVAGPPGELSETALEALLFVAEKPLTRREIGLLAGVPADVVDARLGDLEVSLRDRGLRLLAAGDRVELATVPEAGALLARYLGVDAVRLSSASLETLAIVAYRQPVTKAAIERIRGVDTDYTLRALVHRRLVVEQGRAGGPGRPILYGTGFDFLERFALASLEDLPPLDPDVAARLSEEGGDVTVAEEGGDGMVAEEGSPLAEEPAADAEA